MKTITSLALYFLALTSFGQRTETFDLATYRAPKDWKLIGTTTDAVGYAITNKANGTYSQIAIYKSVATIGTPQQDFDADWQDLIVKPYKVAEKPEAGPSATEDGWEGKTGYAPFAFGGGQSIAMLMTMSGHGKRLSVVMVTNTQEFKGETQNFIESIHLQKPTGDIQATTTTTKKNAQQAPPSTLPKNTFAFSSTNFDDDWTSTARENWVEVKKNTAVVLLHFGVPITDEMRSDQVTVSWNMLAAGRYTVKQFYHYTYSVLKDFPYYFLQADAIDKSNGRNVFVSFEAISKNGVAYCYEIITPTKNEFQQQFPTMDNIERMGTYNKFAVAAADLTGRWSNKFSGIQQYVNAYTGADAGATSHASAETFQFIGDSYSWQVNVASGMVGNAKFQNASSRGKFSMLGNWQVNFSDIEGKPKTYNAFFSCVKGARILWLEDSTYPNGSIGYGKVE